MNNLFFKAALLISGLAFIACGGDSNTVRDSARESLGGNAQTAPASPTSTPLTASAPGGAVFHYICPKNCPGSGAGAAGTCPVCGTAYVHNQAYHSQAQPGAASPTGETTPDGRQIEKMIVPGSTTPAAPGSTTAAPPEPAQNAAGVWHYTCPKGCAGGAGSAVACGTCGTTLAHNTAYHQ